MTDTLVTEAPRLMRLYAMPGACSLASHIVLAWTAACYDVELLTHEAVRGDVYRTLNPKGVVPTLVLEDGAVLTESLAILEYLADRFPHAHLGADVVDLVGCARLNEALSELVSDVHPAWSPIFVPERYVTLEANQDDAKLAAFRQLELHYRRLDGMMTGKTWLLFDRRTIADAYLYVLCTWQARTPTPLRMYPALDAFKARLDADPGVQKALREEQPTTTAPPVGELWQVERGRAPRVGPTSAR